MSKYSVEFEKSLYYYLEVEANSEDEAENIALEKYLNAENKAERYIDDISFRIYSTDLIKE